MHKIKKKMVLEILLCACVLASIQYWFRSRFGKPNRCEMFKNLCAEKSIQICKLNEWHKIHLELCLGHPE